MQQSGLELANAKFANCRFLVLCSLPIQSAISNQQSAMALATSALQLEDLKSCDANAEMC
jgi:hypothetical protein